MTRPGHERTSPASDADARAPVEDAGQAESPRTRSSATTTHDSIRKLVIAHRRSDEAAFRAAVEELIAESKRKNFTNIARELERILASPGMPSSIGAVPVAHLSSRPATSALPKDRERDALLLEDREPERALEDLVLEPGIRAQLDAILRENREGELLRAHGYRPVHRLLFCGPPGCGKTVAAEALAKALYLPLVLVRFDAVVSSYLGETAANLRKVFDHARVRPMVVLFDEFDAIGKSRSDESEHGELKRVVNAFLQMLDGFRGHALLIASTNHERLLDPALWRRFDDIVLFSRPSLEEIRELLVRNLRQIGLAPGVKLERQARRLLGQSHADVERVALDAAKATLLERLDAVSAPILEAAVGRQLSRTAIHSGTAKKRSSR